MSIRIASMDQFRGYTMTGMFLVNFIGSFAVVPLAFKHHNTYRRHAVTLGGGGRVAPRPTGRERNEA